MGIDLLTCEGRCSLSLSARSVETRIRRIRVAVRHYEVILAVETGFIILSMRDVLMIPIVVILMHYHWVVVGVIGLCCCCGVLLVVVVVVVVVSVA